MRRKIANKVGRDGSVGRETLPRWLLNAAKIMFSCQVELLNAARSRTEREVAPQGLKPSSNWPFSARLKSCPDTKRFPKLARNRLTRPLVLQSSIKREWDVTRCGTAEAVPFVQGIFSSEHRARGAGVETADLSTTLRSGRDDNSSCTTNLSSRPERSVVERSAVSNWPTTQVMTR
jgi:hypothetical protein